MGDITRRGYRIEWFIGDHGPRHVQAYDAKGWFLGRLAAEQGTSEETAIQKGLEQKATEFAKSGPEIYTKR